MISLVIATILCLIVTGVGIFMLIQDNYDLEFCGVTLSVTGGLATIVFAIIVAAYGFDWKSADYKASIINREYGTDYTKEEVFYAKDVIETIQQIKRTRIDIQGLEVQ